MSGADWIPFVLFALFAFFGVLLPRLAKRQAKWQRNLPPKDGTGREVRKDERDPELEDALGSAEDDWLEDEGPVVWTPPRRPPTPAPTPVPLPVRLPRPAPPPTRPLRQPSPAMLAARAQARAPQAPRPRRAALVRNRAEARRGITLMAVLGPCRAFEPY